MRTLFRYLLDEREWRTHDAFLAAFTPVAHDLGLTGIEPASTTFEAWYYGKRRPQRDARRVLVNMLGHSIDQLWAQVPEGVPATPAVPGVSGFDHGGDLNEMKRTGAMAARRAKDFVLGAERNRVGEEAIGFLDDEVARLVADYPRVPLADIWDDLAAAQDDAFRLLEGGRLRPTQLRDLHFKTAVLSFLMAKGSNDMGDPKAAMMQARTALACAADAEHPGLTALANGLKSLIAYWADRPEDAVHFARQGASHTSAGGGTVGLWMLGLEARAAALLGDAETVRTLTRTAEEQRDHMVPDDLDALGGLLTYPAAKQLYYAVEAEVLLGHGDDRLSAQAAEAVNAFSDSGSAHWAFGDLAGAQCNHALTFVHAGDLEGAAAAIRPVLDLPANQRNNGIVVSAERVRHALSGESLRHAVVARELREEIAQYGHGRLALPRG